MHVLVFMLYEWYFFRKNVQFSRDEHEHEHEHEKKNTPSEFSKGERMGW